MVGGGAMVHRSPTLKCLAIAWAITSSLGCGRRATEADCTLIFERIAELELQSAPRAAGDDAGIPLNKSREVRELMAEDLKGCVGRRVSDRMIACVKQAATSDEAVKCMR